MDPMTIGAVVLAIVSGAAGEAGGRLWDGLRKLVRRPIPGRPDIVDSATKVSGGIAELEALEQAPADERQAVVLAEALLARADTDTAFRHELETWWAQASQISGSYGSVTSTISGGTQYGPVLQGRDFTEITFNTNSPPQQSEE
jgi:hypothetical protein